MKIFKHSENSELFQIKEITDEQLIAFNDICKNYKQSLLQIIKMPDHQMKQFAPGNPDLAREAIRLQIKTCMAYEMAFADVLAIGDQPKPKDN